MVFPKNLNHVMIGSLLGILAPPIVLLVTYHYRLQAHSLAEFIHFLLTFQALSNLISLCVVPNLLLFFIFIWTDKLASARGVVMATMFYAFLVFVIKFSM
jgi:hypothetical protein